MKIAHDHPSTSEFALQAGKLIQNFGVIELTSYRWIEALSASAIAAEISKELTLGKRIEIILRLLHRGNTLSAELKARAETLWKKVKDEGLERRNTVAHGTVSLSLLESDPSFEPQTIGILKIKKWQDTDELMGLDELKNAVNVTYKIANELNAMLPVNVT
jgi:hypothetical protein